VRARPAIAVAVLALLCGARARADDAPSAKTTDTPPAHDAAPAAKDSGVVDFDPADILSDTPDHLLKRSWFGDRFWFSGQVNLIFQGHPGFSAEYSGPNSLKKSREEKLSEVTTLYSGIRLLKYTELLIAGENAAGKGLSNALGLAGFTNVDVVRNPDLGAEPYLSRILIHQTIPLSDEMAENPNYGPLSMRRELPARRLELRIGRMTLPDFFDQNSVGSDSHLQLTNWATVNDAAWDYAADTRGYTYAVMVEYQDPLFGARFASAVMPKVANGIDLDWRLDQAHAENLELEVHGKAIGDGLSVARLLLWENRARMGNYRESIALFRLGLAPAPDITATRRARRTKYGIGLNVEQELADGLVRVFARAGVNDGKNESFAYTEAENSVSAGFDLRGDLWRRERDRLGVAFASNGLGPDHRTYLHDGGLGFLLGDGTLRYRRESILEAYYTCKLDYGISFGPLFEHIWNPGYNRDRGPVAVYGVRFHLEI
jgi:hypothetical protein